MPDDVVDEILRLVLMASTSTDPGARAVAVVATGRGAGGLLDRCGRRWVATGHRVLRVDLDGPAPPPWAVVRGLFADHLGPTSDGPPATLAAVLAGEGGTVPDLALVADGAAWLVADLADDGPVVLVVDEAQWMDSPSLAVLDRLRARVVDLPVALVLGVRAGARTAVCLELVEAAATVEVGPVPGKTAPAIDVLRGLDGAALTWAAALVLLPAPRHRGLRLELAGGLRRPDGALAPAHLGAARAAVLDDLLVDVGVAVRDPHVRLADAAVGDAVVEELGAAEADRARRLAATLVRADEELDHPEAARPCEVPICGAAGGVIPYPRRP